MSKHWGVPAALRPGGGFVTPPGLVEGDIDEGVIGAGVLPESVAPSAPAQPLQAQNAEERQFPEELVRYAARIAAEESLRVFRPEVGQGQEAVIGAGSTVSSRTLDAAIAGTFDLTGPVRSLSVISGGRSEILIRAIRYDNTVQDIPGVSGLYLADAAFAGIQIVIPAGLVGDIIFLWSTVPHAFGDPCCITGVSALDDKLGEAQITQVTDTGAGNASIDVALDAGYQYEFKGMTHKVLADATAGNRRTRIAINDDDGTTERAMLWHPDSQAADQTLYTVVTPGHAVTSALTIVNDAWAWLGTAWCGRFAIGQAALAAFTTTVTAGAAGDVVEILSFWKRRKIL